MSNGRVAPHEACEVRLVAAGTKPLATVEKHKQPLLYSIAVSLWKAGAIHGECLPSRDSPEGEVVITSHRNKHLVAVYKDLLANGVADFGIKEYHRRMGKLFGYRAEDIEAFIEAEIYCDCSKCRGGN